MTTQSDVVAYIDGIKNVKILRLIPCLVTIGRQTYPAARYVEQMQHSPWTPAYARGEREYMREMVYCVGMLPSVKLRGNVAFTVDGDSRDWYVAAYYGNVKDRRQETAEPNEFHPFGNSFILAPWDIKDSTIDQYERVPYRRVACHMSEKFSEGVA